MLYTSLNSLRKRGINSNKKAYATNMVCQDTRQLLIGRKREGDSRNIMSIL
jgi:hypothetical protein